ncbi:MAG TPA: pitrilysin family protein [Longimicrobiales bacterium]
MRNHLRVLALAAIATFPAAAFAQRTAPPTKFETFTLDNGLRFIVHEDHSTPIVAVDVWYDVGSANEALGRSGFAHLFEHMLFQETENLPKGAFDTYLEEAGGQLNGTTNQDRTMYYEIVPSNRVNLALWLEAERMARLKVTKENFEREREVVKEERRMRIDNAPYGNGFLMLDTLHTDYKPYRHTVIGTMDDLNAATTQDVIDFYKQYYVPNNATIVLAGDITLEQARKFAQEYFGDIKTGQRITPLPAPTAVPRTDGERRQVVEDKLASVPLIMGAYNIPPHEDKDIYALQLLGAVLGQGESSRLFQRLVKQEKAATFAGSGLASRWKGGYMSFQAQPVQGVEAAKVEGLLWEEVEKVKTQGITAEELNKAKRQFIAGQIMSRQMVLSKAEAIQHARFMHGDINSVNTDLDNYNAVTLEDVKRVANKYLVTPNRTVVTVVPAAKKPAT